MKIVHITTVHNRTDSRIFYKECSTLSAQGWDVTLIVADNKGDQIINNVKIIDIGKQSNRLKRILFLSQKAIKKAKSLKADIYHFHDPDLYLASMALTKQAKVIFDSHEDFPLLMLQREYIPHILRHIFFHIAKHIEKKCYTKLSAVVCATDNIKEKFINISPKHPNKAITITNYPMIQNNQYLTKEDYFQRQDTAVYVGGLTQIRGVEQMVKTCYEAKIPLILVGEFDNKQFLNYLKSSEAWQNVEYLGFVAHNELKDKVYSRSTIGLNMLLDAPNHKHSIPIKQLEYMSYGLPVISTKYINFCVEVTKQTSCGIVVDPLNIQDCATKLKELSANKSIAYDMGLKGQKAVSEKYNWQIQADKLIDLYKRLTIKK